MPDAHSLAPIVADLTFTVRQESKPWFESSQITGGAPRVHFRTEERPVPIHDMRADADRLSLDVTGFELRRHETAVDDLYDDGAGADVYDREVEALLKRLTGADIAVVFDRTRRSDAGAGASNPDGMRMPASRVHVDYTDGSGPTRARDVLGGETVDRVLGAGGRIVQINVWRPIRGPVRRSPLALADAGSIPKDDLIATDQIFPDRVGEIYQLAFSPAHRWYWAPEMERDEVLLIKGWDSLDDGRARYTPHGAFALPGQDPAAPPRESIELRTFIA
ncbi:MAG: methyltransferase, partial [Alphaproteobacteria bacterium]|nr:methyltransferase [Alphaproteobacteria bacterium]